MKRKIENTLPPAKKRKIDKSPPPKVENDPSVIVPKLRVSSVFNGIVCCTFSNIDEFYEQEIATHNIYQFELLYKRNHGEWKSITYFNHEVSCYEHVYFKVLVDIKDYELHLKLRSKLNGANHTKWSEFSEPISIQIASSLIAHQFKVGEYVEFRDKDEYYSREGKIVQVLPDNHVRIRPFYSRLMPHSNHNRHEPAEEDEEEEEEDEERLLDAEQQDEPIWRRYTGLEGLYYFMAMNEDASDREVDASEHAADSGDNKMDDDDTNPPDHEDEEDGDFDANEQELIRNVSMHDEDGHSDSNDDREAEAVFDSVARLSEPLMINTHNHHSGRRRKRRRKYVDVHCSRLYGDGIRLPSVVDITENQRTVDKMMLLRTDNEQIMDMYCTLNEVYCEYAQNYVESINNSSYYDSFDDQYQLKFIGRFISINVCDFLLEHDRFKWKIACLRESSDGQMELNPVRKDIIGARIEGLKDQISGMNLYDIDNIIGFCDICRLEISDYDW
eukprot:CAMPEP_0197052728 /NCGR_PEP_ID=MMETSP1384-20130603/27149_1 /TAXON_ID=29189 /ORGANISM="Ammonia sp." /LENGTH=500 /DNA_ID=CAMNT_0042485525 /DNA_START=31 /DNA_END=1530 /DNA_ORIENTATION=-